MRGFVDAASLGLLKLAVSSWVIARGVTAISDDDFARVVIAQKFAVAPSLDPSGTSWLPLPFWIYGTALSLFGRQWEIARATAVLLGVVSVWLLWASARWMGATRRGAFLGAALAAIFPYSAWLGVATVPELPTASLTLVALAASSRIGELSRGTITKRPWIVAALGTVCITAACASRYEAWPVAFGLALFTLRDRALGPLPTRALFGLAQLSFPLAWLGHGLVRHDDALFFIKRVTDYKRALGESSSGRFEALWSYPEAFFRAEPELLLVALALLLLGGTGLAWRRPTFLFAVQLLVLIGGEVRGGAPTHHAERALLSGWLLAALLAGDSAARLDWNAWRTQLGLPRRPLYWALGGAAVPLSLFGCHHWVRRPDLRTVSFIQRRAELDIGQRARNTEALESSTQPLLVASEDYGYFAVQAGFGAVERVYVLDRHDPRDQKAKTPPLDRLRDLVARTNASWAVVPSGWSGVEGLGHVTAANSEFLLLSLWAGNSPPSGQVD